MSTLHELTTQFRKLHEHGCFLIPNPWDVGSARLLAGLGFPALATTSSGFAWSRGIPDNRATLDGVLHHLQEIASAVSVPVNADFEGGFATQPADVFANVARAMKTGIAGISIEDSTGDMSAPLHDFALAVERVRAARRAIDESGTNVLLTGRSEGFIVDRPDLRETIKRLLAYADAGAECLYAPGIRSHADIEVLVRELTPYPVNVLVNGSFFTVQQLADIGVRRISVGGALARTAYGAAVAAAQEMLATGTFGGLTPRTSATDFDTLFG